MISPSFGFMAKLSAADKFLALAARAFVLRDHAMYTAKYTTDAGRRVDEVRRAKGWQRRAMRSVREYRTTKLRLAC